MKLRLVVVLYVLMMPRVSKVDNIALCRSTLFDRPAKLAEFASEFLDRQNDPSGATSKITVKHVKIADSAITLSLVAEVDQK